jgi:hypothetical protein
MAVASPFPPLVETEPERIATFGSTSIHAAVVREPWRLPIDALVVPTGADGNLQGGLAEALRKAGGPQWSSIEDRFRSELRSRDRRFAPGDPVLVEWREVPFSKARMFIFATAGSQLPSRAGAATEAVVKLALAHNVSSLGLPFLGSGKAGLATPEETAELMLTALSRVVVGSGLQSVYVTTLSQSAFNLLKGLGAKLSGNDTAQTGTTAATTKEAAPVPPQTPPADQVSQPVSPTPPPPPERTSQATDQPTTQQPTLRPAAVLAEESLRDRQLGLEPAARDVIALAGHLSASHERSSGKPARLTTESLFFAMVERGRVPDGGQDVEALRLLGRAVVKQPPSQYSGVLTSYLGSEPPPQNPDATAATVIDMTANVRTVLGKAGELQTAVGSARIGPASLVLALLETEESLSPGYHSYLQSLSLVRQDLLHELKPELLRLCRPTEPLASFWTDNPNASAEDYLDIGKEVKAFAYLAAGKTIDPPLSIGIFGEWGSGKTFFMERMYECVEKITEKDSAYQKTGKFHAGVVQIRFNAWHYIESNLWASLVEFIFQELDRWLSEHQVERGKIDRLFDQLTTSKQLRLDAVRDLLTSRGNLKEAKAKLGKARDEYEEALKTRAKLTPSDLRAAAWEIVVGEAQNNPEIKSAAVALGLPHLRESEAGLRQLVDDSRTQVARASLLGQALFAQIGTPQVAVVAIAAIVGAPLVIEGLRQTLGQLPGWAWIKEFNAGVFAVTSFIGVLLATGRVLLDRGIKALNVLDTFRAKLDRKVAERTETERQAVLKAEKDVSDKQQAVGDAERGVTAATQLAAAAELEYASDSSQGRLNRFIRAKVADGSYAKHLGIIATIRKDFGQLATLMQGEASSRDTQRILEQAHKIYVEKLEALLKEQENDKKELLTKDEVDKLKAEPKQEELPFFDRIILYIDDLDRCPPDKVAEVLQAIHMLLFFPLFVVVVAVDARWIARSLETEFPHLLRAAAGDQAPATPGATSTQAQPAGETPPARSQPSKRNAAVARGNGQAGPDGDVGRRGQAAGSCDGQPATAEDYLEKIFQIPFWVRRMDRDASKAFIRGITRKSVAGAQQNQESRQGREERDGKQSREGEQQRREQDTQLENKGQEEAQQGAIVPENQQAKDPDDKQNAGKKPVEQPQSQEGKDEQRHAEDLIALETLSFTPGEVALLEEFAPFLGGSPRRAKRFVNLYHLLRTNLRDMPPISSDARVDARALIAALAVTTGAPYSASAFFRALEADTGETNGATKGKKTYVDLPAVLATLDEAAGANGTSTRAVIQHLIDINGDEKIKLNDGRVVSNGPDMTEALSKLAATVRRYSFEMMS